MAETSELSRHIDHNLWLVGVMVEDELDDITSDGEASDTEWASWTMDWHDAMSRLGELVDLHQAGQMTEAQARRLQEILVALRRRSHLIERFNLTSPPVPLAAGAEG